MEASDLTSLDMFTLANPSSSCLCCTLSGAPFYTTYTCADGGLVAVGAIEAQVLLPGSTIGSCIHFTILQFYRALLQGLGCQEQIPAAHQMDSTTCGRQLVHTVSIVCIMFVHS